MESPFEARQRRLLVEQRIRDAVTASIQEQMVDVGERQACRNGTTYLEFMASSFRGDASPLALRGAS